MAWLEQHINLERSSSARLADGKVAPPNLERMRHLVELLGSPQIEYPVVHVTGTNGKTSTARMVTELLKGQGLSVGLYTSPHLERINERLVWGGEVIGDAALAEALLPVMLAERGLLASGAAEPLTFFEIVTAAAFRWFADVAVDVAVVEVGLGGAWDATNVVAADIAVITNVSIDHVEYLGATRESIAREKAGIIEPQSVVVLGEDDRELRSALAGCPGERQLVREEDFRVVTTHVAHGGRMLDLITPGGEYSEVFLPLHGAHQADNAAIALTAAEAFLGGTHLDGDAVVEAFAAVRSPGRLEVVGRRPLVLLDGAHNVAGAEALATALAEEFIAAPRVFVVGFLEEKDPREMLAALGVLDAQMVIACRPPSPRGRPASEVGDAAVALGVPFARVRVVEIVAEALAAALAEIESDGQVIVTGSLYVVGAARAAIRASGGAFGSLTGYD